ncbi:MAG: HPr(Ser) kinase/phosphatase, partial [Erysipelotrichaceae bacterium]|nr:HPr(Ser) kinase/phosphatase [Erysipelotrichaceae bacterium]
MIVKDVLNYFNYRVVTGDEQAFQRPVTVLDVVRPGLELCGYYEYSKMKRIFILGDKEIHYIDSLTEQQQKERFDYLTNEETPFILIARDHMCPPVLEDIAKKKNFPVFSSYATTSSLMVELMSFLEEQLAPSVSVHGVLMNLYGTGVLIKGKSSMGKSEIA